MANENPADQGNDGGQQAPALTIETIKSAGVPEAYLKDGAYDFGAISKDLGELTSMRTAQAERAKSIPESADKYDFGLPKDFKLPEGVGEWQPNPEFTKTLSAIAHEHGVPQSAMTKFAQAYAQNQIAQINASNKEWTDAVSSLGSNGQTRIDNVQKALAAKGYGALVDDKASFKDRIEALEAIANGVQRQAAKGNGAVDNKVDTSKMSPRQKLDYANEQSMRAKH